MKAVAFVDIVSLHSGKMKTHTDTEKLWSKGINKTHRARIAAFKAPWLTMPNNGVSGCKMPSYGNGCLALSHTACREPRQSASSFWFAPILTSCWKSSPMKWGMWRKVSLFLSTFLPGFYYVICYFRAFLTAVLGHIGLSLAFIDQ